MFYVVLEAANVTKWIEGEWHDAMFQPQIELVGGPILGLLVGGTVLTSLYIAGRRDLATPTVFVMIFLPLLNGFLPESMQQVAWTVAMLGLVAAIMAVARAYIIPR